MQIPKEFADYSYQFCLIVMDFGFGSDRIGSEISIVAIYPDD
jgi:hypothetical protein